VLRLSELEKGVFKISQMVVQPQMQGKGLGSRVLTELVDIALAKGAIEVCLNARLHAVSMYKKLGFEITGSAYLAKSTGVPHIKMVKSGLIAHNI
jgi:predicted GNAT family N-acyltransferase